MYTVFDLKLHSESDLIILQGAIQKCIALESNPESISVLNLYQRLVAGGDGIKDFDLRTHAKHALNTLWNALQRCIETDPKANEVSTITAYRDIVRAAMLDNSLSTKQERNGQLILVNEI